MSKDLEPLPWVERFFPFEIPKPWHLESEFGPDGRIYINTFLRLSLILSGCEYEGERWIHLSLSSPDHRLPTWEELVEVKRKFLGKDSLAIQVLPRERDYVNIHENCLHLWMCLDRDPVPNWAEIGRKEFGFKSV